MNEEVNVGDTVAGLVRGGTFFLLSVLALKQQVSEII